jgi:hypothetical protein
MAIPLLLRVLSRNWGAGQALELPPEGLVPPVEGAQLHETTRYPLEASHSPNFLDTHLWGSLVLRAISMEWHGQVPLKIILGSCPGFCLALWRLSTLGRGLFSFRTFLGPRL